jgi:hypothetical protein
MSLIWTFQFKLSNFRLVSCSHEEIEISLPTIPSKISLSSLLQFKIQWCLLPPSSGWWVTHCPDDGGSKLLWNVSRFLPDYMAQHPRRQSSSYLPQWEPVYNMYTKRNPFNNFVISFEMDCYAWNDSFRWLLNEKFGFFPRIIFPSSSHIVFITFFLLTLSVLS